MRRFLATAGALVLVVGVTACGTDAKKGDRDTGTADIVNMPDGVPNVAHKCVRLRNGEVVHVYVTDHGNTAGGGIAIDTTAKGCDR